jgi:hypothetical protein
MIFELGGGGQRQYTIQFIFADISLYLSVLIQISRYAATGGPLYLEFRFFPVLYLFPFVVCHVPIHHAAHT